MAQSNVVFPLSSPWPGRLSGWWAVQDEKHFARLIATVLNGHWDTMRGLTLHGGDEGRVVVEQYYSTIAELLCVYVLRLTDNEWEEVRKWRGPHGEPETARKVRYRLWLLREPDALRKKYAYKELERLREEKKQMRPRWRQFWKEYQSLFGGYVDAEVECFAALKAEAVAHLLDQMFRWSGSTNSGDARLLSHAWYELG